MSPPQGPRDDEPIPKIVYRRKPDEQGEPREAGVPAAPAAPPDRPSATGSGTDSPAILAAREEMRRAAAREEAREEARAASPAEPAPPRSAASARPLPRPGSRAGLLVWGLAGANLLLLVASLFAMRHFSAARAWEESSSYDLGDEQAAALAGLNFLVIAASVAAGGFAVSALGLLSRTSLGRRVALVWAGVCTLTLVGAIYGLPSWLLLRSRGVQERLR